VHGAVSDVEQDHGESRRLVRGEAGRGTHGCGELGTVDVNDDSRIALTGAEHGDQLSDDLFGPGGARPSGGCLRLEQLHGLISRAGQHLSHGLDRHPDGAQPGQQHGASLLFTGVVAVAGVRIDLGRRQQARFVVVAQRAWGQVDGAGELADRQ